MWGSLPPPPQIGIVAVLGEHSDLHKLRCSDPHKQGVTLPPHIPKVRLSLCLGMWGETPK